MRIMSLAFGVALACFWGIQTNVNAGSAKPAVLFVRASDGGESAALPTSPLMRRLAAKGFVVDAKRWREVKPGTLERYDGVVFCTMGKVDPGKQPAGAVAERLKMLNAYLAGGGSALVSPLLSEDPKNLVPVDMFLKKYGAAIQLSEIKDPGKLMILPPWMLRFVWTDKINRKFLGLPDSDKYLWYPVGPYKYGLRSYPFKLDAAWTPIVETSASSMTTTRFIGTPYFDAGREKKTISGSQPIVAVRETGKGRLAVFGIYHSYVFTDPYAPALGGVFTDKGLNNRRSCGFDLLNGLLRWLTAESVAMKRARPKNSDPALLRPYGAERCPVRPPSKWSRFKYQNLKFEKGAIFAVPDSADVAEYIAAVKKSGMRFAILAKRTDAFKSDHAGLERFKQACLKASTAKTALIPGVIIKDVYGGTRLITGKNIQYPQKVIFDEEKQAIVKPKRELPGSNGELGDAWMHYVFGQIGSQMAVDASMDHKNAKYPYSDFRDYNSMIVVLCENGKVAENMLPEFLRLQNRGENLLPLALHKISSSGEIAEIADKDRWVVELSDKETPEKFFSRHHMLDNPQVYITSGPKIKYWMYKGERDFSNTGNPYDYSRWHFAVKLDVASEIGLKEVLVYDGTEVFKKFELSGAKTFRDEFPILHSRQHNLTLVVRDVKGGEAISAEIFDRSHLAEEFMCGDRNNQLFYSVQRRKKGSEVYFSRGVSYGMTPNKGPWSGETGIYSAYNDDPLHRLAVVGFDGGAAACAVGYTLPNKGIKGEIPLRSDPDRVLNTSDVAIGMTTLNSGYPIGSKTSNVWHTILPVIPTKYLDATVTQTYFIPRPYDDMPVLKQDVTLKFKQEYSPVKGRKLLFRLLEGQMRDKMSWLVKSSNGKVYSGTFKEPGRNASDTFVLPFGRGAYLRMGEGTSGSYSIVSMTDGLVITERRNSTHFFIGYPNDGETIPAGRSFSARFLFIGEPFNGPANNMAVENAVSAFLQGDDSNLEIISHTGSIVERKNYPIVVQAADNTWKGNVSAKLAVAVPLKITGLNPRSSGYVFFPKINKWRPLTILPDGFTFLSLPGKGKEDVVVCNPLLNDDKRIEATLVQLTDDVWELYAANNSSEKIDAVFKINPAFAPFAKFADVKLTVPPHGSATTKMKKVVKEADLDF